MSLQEEYKNLLQDTISYLKQQENKYTFASQEDIFFLTTNSSTIDEKRKTTLSKSPLKIPPPTTDKLISPPPKKELDISTPPIPPKDKFKELEAILKKAAPQIDIYKNTLDDSKAKKISEGWKYKNQAADITILSFQEDKKKLKFLENLRRALDTYFLPTKIISANLIDHENGWDIFLSAPQLKLILATHDISTFPHLMKHYRDYPSRSEKFLGKASLFLLPDLSIYLKDPMLKRLLWKVISTKIHSLSGNGK